MSEVVAPSSLCPVCWKLSPDEDPGPMWIKPCEGCKTSISAGEGQWLDLVSRTDPVPLNPKARKR
jgi:hypothetical protein